MIIKFLCWIWDEIFDEDPVVIFGALFWGFFVWIVVFGVIILYVIIKP